MTWQISFVDYERYMAVKVSGTERDVMRSFIPRMLAAGKASPLINTASTGSFQGCPMMSAYIASKFEVVGVAESLHYELQREKTPVQVSLLSRGPVKTVILPGSPSGSIDHPEVQKFAEGLAKLQVEDGISTEEFSRRVLHGMKGASFGYSRAGPH